MTMNEANTGEQLWRVLSNNLPQESIDWIRQKLDAIIGEKSARSLFMTYSLMATKISGETPEYKQEPTANIAYLESHEATLRQVARLYLLVAVLEKDRDYFSPKVGKLIQVADKSELETFLRYLPLLPGAEDFKESAVEALRTNIATVFDAIALDNPYPANHFNDQQWNQMYLKAAFMQRDLVRIPEVDKRANADLTRIISDYAHERWAASRDVDPQFWRPVSKFIEGPLVQDMEKLLESTNVAENRAGALCCYHSDKEEAQTLLANYPDLMKQVAEGKITWENIKN